MLYFKSTRFGGLGCRLGSNRWAQPCPLAKKD